MRVYESSIKNSNISYIRSIAYPFKKLPYVSVTKDIFLFDFKYQSLLIFVAQQRTYPTSLDRGLLMLLCNLLLRILIEHVR